MQSPAQLDRFCPPNNWYRNSGPASFLSLHTVQASLENRFQRHWILRAFIRFRMQHPEDEVADNFRHKIQLTG